MAVRRACLLLGVLWAGAAGGSAPQQEARPTAGVNGAEPSPLSGRWCLHLGMSHAEIPAWVPTLGCCFQHGEEL